MKLLLIISIILLSFAFGLYDIDEVINLPSTEILTFSSKQYK